MELVRHKIRLSVFAFLAASLATSWCAAQYQDGNGLGNSPMGPASPGSYSQPAVPGPPPQPSAPSRPTSWPGQEAPAETQQSPTGDLPPPTPGLTLCEGTRILARVGSEVILESDVSGPVNDLIEANKDRIPPDQLEATREFLIKKHLKNFVQNKLIFLDAKRTIPSEGWSNVEKQLNKAFEDSEPGRPSELDKLMKRIDANSRSELDAKLRRLGTSIERERRLFAERELAKQWIHQQIKRDDEITYDQMVTYYRQHLQEFTTPAKVQWQELMVSVTKYPSDAEAFDALARMGNQIIAGADFAELAKNGSNGPTSTKGGVWDWTIQGSLVCKEIDKALFSLPVGQLSPIIKSSSGYHIVRVTNREDAKVAPFLDAQVDIRERIVKQRNDKQLREYLTKIEAKTPVWTIYDVAGKPSEMLSSRPDTQLR